jgi:hypothetical protein
MEYARLLTDVSAVIYQWHNRSHLCDVRRYTSASAHTLQQDADENHGWLRRPDCRAADNLERGVGFGRPIIWLSSRRLSVGFGSHERQHTGNRTIRYS